MLPTPFDAFEEQRPACILGLTKLGAATHTTLTFCTQTQNGRRASQTRLRLVTRVTLTFSLHQVSDNARRHSTVQLCFRWWRRAACCLSCQSPPAKLPHCSSACSFATDHFSGSQEGSTVRRGVYTVQAHNRSAHEFQHLDLVRSLAVRNRLEATASL